MKFLCPIDFSSAAINGSEYAAQLARDLNATLTLVYVQPIYAGDGVTMFSMGEMSSSKEAIEAEQKLEEMCRAIEEEYAVKANHHVDFSSFKFEADVADESKTYDLLITGTNGTETLNQFYTGSHSYKLARRSKCPVLIIPEDCIYKKPRKVVFASAYNTDDELVFEQLKDFINLLHPMLEVVHISESDTPLSQEVFASFTRLTRAQIEQTTAISFRRIINKDAGEGLSQFMNHSDADLLIMCFEKHGLLYRMFNKNLIKSVSAESSGFPLLITHK